MCKKILTIFFDILQPTTTRGPSCRILILKMCKFREVVELFVSKITLKNITKKNKNSVNDTNILNNIHIYIYCRFQVYITRYISKWPFFGFQMPHCSKFSANIFLSWKCKCGYVASLPRAMETKHSKRVLLLQKILLRDLKKDHDVLKTLTDWRNNIYDYTIVYFLFRINSVLIIFLQKTYTLRQK